MILTAESPARGPRGGTMGCVAQEPLRGPSVMHGAIRVMLRSCRSRGCRVPGHCLPQQWFVRNSPRQQEGCPWCWRICWPGCWQVFMELLLVRPARSQAVFLDALSPHVLAYESGGRGPLPLAGSCWEKSWGPQYLSPLSSYPPLLHPAVFMAPEVAALLAPPSHPPSSILHPVSCCTLPWGPEH